MKKINCIQLGGVCNEVFLANTFEEMAELSQQHGEKMFEQGDKAHIKKGSEMKDLMQDPDQMKRWMEDKIKLFNSLPDVE